MSETLAKPAAQAAAEVLYEAGGRDRHDHAEPARADERHLRPDAGGLSDYLLKANADPKVRVVILTGAGRPSGRPRPGGRDPGLGHRLRQAGAGRLGEPRPSQHPPTLLFGMDKPTICALNGAAAGYGLDTALGCDIRIMGEGSKLAAAFVKRGVVPESGGTWLLPRLVGWSKAAELVLHWPHAYGRRQPGAGPLLRGGSPTPS